MYIILENSKMPPPHPSSSCVSHELQPGLSSVYLLITAGTDLQAVLRGFIATGQ